MDKKHSFLGTILRLMLISHQGKPRRKKNLIIFFFYNSNNKKSFFIITIIKKRELSFKLIINNKSIIKIKGKLPHKENRLADF
jgi:hypothetical protein